MHRAILFAVGFFETLIFSGVICGWSPLNSMLKKEKVYKYLCENKGWNDTHVVDISCPEQEQILNLAYTLGTCFMGLTAFIWGFLLDKWGLRIVRLLINTLISSGLVFLALTGEDSPYFVFPAVILMSLGGIPLRMANIQISNLFPENKSTVIALYSGTFSASASIFGFIQFIYDSGLSWKWTFTILVILSLTMLISTFVLLPAKKVCEIPNKPVPVSYDLQKVSQIPMEKIGMLPYSLENKSPLNLYENNNNQLLTVSAQVFHSKSKNKTSLRNTLLSFPNFLHQFWFAWLTLTMIIYSGTLNLWVQRIEPEKEAYFANIFVVFQIFCIVLSPLAGYVIDKSLRSKELSGIDSPIHRWRATFMPLLFTTILAVILQILNFFPSTGLIYASIFLITLFRAVFIGVATSYLSIRFPKEHFNKLMGIMSTVASIANLLQFPLFMWKTQSALDAVYANVLELSILMLTLSNPLQLLITPLQNYFIKTENSVYVSSIST